MRIGDSVQEPVELVRLDRARAHLHRPEGQRFVDADPQHPLPGITFGDRLGEFLKSGEVVHEPAAVGNPPRIHPVHERDHRCHAVFTQCGDNGVVVRQLLLIPFTRFGHHPGPLQAESKCVDAHGMRIGDVFGIPVPEIIGLLIGIHGAIREEIRFVGVYGFTHAALDVTAPIAVGRAALYLVTRGGGAPVEPAIPAGILLGSLLPRAAGRQPECEHSCRCHDGVHPLHDKNHTPYGFLPE
ncbi:Uncharacterised protein [Mycobacteroides abscessus]|nr:Uncharacterised protein [Mycobacteroides abscessus]